MAGRSLTRSLYDKLVDAYREAPGNASHAGRLSGVDRRTAQRAWERGWPAYPWARPIKTVLADEDRLARVRAAEIEARAKSTEDADREKERKEAIEARATELSMLKAARHNVMVGLGAAASLTPSIQLLAKHVADKIQAGLANVDIKEALIILREHSKLVHRAVFAVDQLVALGRLERGQSTVNVGVAPAADLTYEQALEELEGTAELLEVVRAEVGKRGNGKAPPLLVEAEPA